VVAVPSAPARDDNGTDHEHEHDHEQEHEHEYEYEQDQEQEFSLRSKWCDVISMPRLR
jgi:ribosomal protein L12E/L44/L45/RPP1/RPP2